MKVLSLFDGMSCGRIALDQLGIPVEKYYASEIDKYAIQVSQANYPDIEQVGDICNLDPKDYKDVDLMLAGSPCQGFSFAGKQLAFDDPRSALFFEFIRLLKAIKPKYFLLENVRMKKEFLQVISEQVSACYPEITFGIEPIFINSSLLSAQSRQRYYWTNIPNIKQPEDRGIVLRDILETEPSEEFYHSKKSREYMEKGNEKWQQEGKRRADRYEQSADKEKSFTITANWHKGVPYNYFKESKPIKVGMNKEQMIETMTTKEGKSFCLTAQYDAARPNRSRDRKEKTMIPVDDMNNLPEGTRYVYDENDKSHKIETKPKQVGVAVDIKGHDQIKRVYSPEGKSPTVTTCGGGHREPKVVTGGAFRGRAYDKNGKRMDKDGVSVANKTKQMLELRNDNKSNAITTVGKDSIAVNEDLTWRKLTPLECERLQTVPDNYTDHVSNTQRYKMLGNGWTVEVIKHIYKNMDL